jgi:hypothetical protein
VLWVCVCRAAHACVRVMQEAYVAAAGTCAVCAPLQLRPPSGVAGGRTQSNETLDARVPPSLLLCVDAQQQIKAANKAYLRHVASVKHAEELMLQAGWRSKVWCRGSSRARAHMCDARRPQGASAPACASGAGSTAADGVRCHAAHRWRPWSARGCGSMTKAGTSGGACRAPGGAPPRGLCGAQGVNACS